MLTSAILSVLMLSATCPYAACDDGYKKNQGLMYSTIKVRERHPRPHHEGATVFARG